MVGGILTLSVSLCPMVIVDPKNPPPSFYKTIVHMSWSKYPASDSIKQGGEVF
jgi:hypothetical protein